MYPAYESTDNKVDVAKGCIIFKVELDGRTMQPSSQEFKDYMAVIEKTADSNACVYVWHPRVMGSLLPKNDKVKRNSSEIVEFSGEELTFVAFSSGENV